MSDALKELLPWLREPTIGSFAENFARELALEEQGSSRLSAVGGLLVHLESLKGGICLDLARRPEEFAGLAWPEAALWTADLAQSSVVGTPGSFKPLILDGGNLYLNRYHSYETRVARALLRLAQRVHPVTAAGIKLLELEFQSAGDRDEQLLAVATGLTRSLAILTGGPGTGKTTTLLKLVACLAGCGDVHPARILLAAPTGKAAQRLQAALAEERWSKHLPGSIQAQLPAQVQTVQALLRPVPGGSQFRHNRMIPLPADVLILDEVSMIDLPLFAKLLEALPQSCRLVLSGDHRQLPSVHVGSLLADLHSAATPNLPVPETRNALPAIQQGYWKAAPIRREPLGGCLVELRRNHRFSADSAIQAACQSILAGDEQGLLRIVSGGMDGSVRFVEWAGSARSPLPAKHPAVEELGAIPLAESPIQALGLLAQRRILTARREGPQGALAINAALTSQLLPKGDWHGLPLLVTENRPKLNLANGHVGILWRDPQGRMEVHFGKGEGPGHPMDRHRLPGHEPAWAMTVHKSQGSEFDHVIVILGDEPSPLHTRELLFTAVSRARKTVEIRGSREVLSTCLRSALKRSGRLRERLAGI